MAIDRNKVIAAAQKHVQKGAYSRAIKEYQRILRDYPDDVRTLLKIGELEARNGQAEDAARTYNEVADHYLARGFTSKAIAAYKNLLTIAPDDLNAKLRLSDLYYQDGLLRDALINYQQVASAWLERGQTEKYLQTLRRIVEIDPENAGGRIKLAEELQRHGHPDAASVEFLQAATLLKQQGSFEDYARVLERYVAIQPDDEARKLDLARTYLQQDRPKRALIHIQPLLKANPRNAETLDVLVRALSAVSKNPADSIATLEGLAQAFEEDGALGARDEIYKKIIEIDPSHAQARDGLGLSPVVLEPVVTAAAPAVSGGATDTASGASEAGEGDIERLLEEADIYLKYNLFERGLEHLSQVFAIDPFNAGALERRKTSLVGLGRVAEAAQEYYALAAANEYVLPQRSLEWVREAVTLDPSNQLALELEARLSGPAPEVAAEITPLPGVEATLLESGATSGAQGDGFANLDALFSGFEAEPSLPRIEVLPSVDEPLPAAALADPEPEVDLIDFGSDELLPADLDLGLEEVDGMVSSGMIEEARDRLFELLGNWPQYAEILLGKMDELPPSEEPEVYSSHEEPDLFAGADDLFFQPASQSMDVPAASEAADFEEPELEDASGEDSLAQTREAEAYYHEMMAAPAEPPVEEPVFRLASVSAEHIALTPQAEEEPVFRLASISVELATPEDTRAESFSFSGELAPVVSDDDYGFEQTGETGAYEGAASDDSGAFDLAIEVVEPEAGPEAEPHSESGEAPLFVATDDFESVATDDNAGDADDADELESVDVGDFGDELESVDVGDFGDELESVDAADFGDELESVDAGDFGDELESVDASDFVDDADEIEILDGSEVSRAGLSDFVPLAEVDAPVGRASTVIQATFGPADVFLATAPNSPGAEAIQLRRDGRGAEVLFDLSMAAEESGEPALVFELAVANIEMGLYFDAISGLDSLLVDRALAPDDRVLVHYYLGIAYEAMDQPSEARVNFRVVGQSRPELYPDVPLRLARIAE